MLVCPFDKEKICKNANKICDKCPANFRNYISKEDLYFKCPSVRCEAGKIKDEFGNYYTCHYCIGDGVAKYPIEYKTT